TEIPIGQLKDLRGDPKTAVWYQPAAITQVRNVLKSLDLPVSETTFIDLGCGKGRALFIAAEYPFRSIVGADFSPELSEMAEENIRSYGHRYPEIAARMSVICMDAAQYEFPPDTLCIYMYNPFGVPVLEGVVRQLERSLKEHPRRLVILYFNAI